MGNDLFEDRTPIEDEILHVENLIDLFRYYVDDMNSIALLETFLTVSHNIHNHLQRIVDYEVDILSRLKACEDQLAKASSLKEMGCPLPMETFFIPFARCPCGADHEMVKTMSKEGPWIRTTYTCPNKESR